MLQKVLIAEDNPLNMKLFRDLLHTKNLVTICVSDGRKVLKETLKHMPNLILMDIRLSDISGLDVIRDIKKNPKIKSIPIVALTAFAMKSDQTKILSSGCEDYIAKPIVIDSFFKMISKFISLETV